VAINGAVTGNVLALVAAAQLATTSKTTNGHKYFDTTGTI
jgi:hypothetical protein